MPHIYKITSPSGKVYVGSTAMTGKKRWNCHTCDYRRWVANGKEGYSTAAMEVFDEAGYEVCKYEVIEEVADGISLKERERYWTEQIECVNRYKPIRSEEEKKTYDSEYHVIHHEEIRTRQKAYHEANRAKILERQRLNRLKRKAKLLPAPETVS